jgi:MoaA/NifB/PqqE/SkfB family radical SAM enzyme
VKAEKLGILLRSAASAQVPALYETLRLRPSYAWINPTDNCNMRCVMCNQWRTQKTDELTLDEWTEIFRQLSAAGVRMVGLNGGEPLLFGDVAAMIESAGRHGLNTDLTTSAFLMTDRKLDALIAAGLPSVTMSIDGVGAQYESIRGRDWTRVEAAARRVAAASAAGRIRAQIGFVLMKPTLDHVDGILRFAAELGLPVVFNLVDSTPYFFRIPENQRSAHSHWVGEEDRERLRVALRKIVAASSARPGSISSSFSALDFATDYFDDPLQKSIPCTVSQLRLLIDSHGEVFGGCWSMESYGCLRRQTLREILDSDAFRKAHRAMFYKDCPGCSCGYDVNVKYSLQRQVREQLFRRFPGRRARIGASGPGPSGAA